MQLGEEFKQVLYKFVWSVLQKLQSSLQWEGHQTSQTCYHQKSLPWTIRGSFTHDSLKYLLLLMSAFVFPPVSLSPTQHDVSCSILDLNYQTRFWISWDLTCHTLARLVVTHQRGCLFNMNFNVIYIRILQVFSLQHVAVSEQLLGWEGSGIWGVEEEYW